MREPTPRQDERSLLGRARAGDAGAFLSLVEPHDRRLRALAFRLLGDRDAMDDALQAAYVNAFRGIGSFGGRASVSTWLYRIAYNACRDELRRRGRTPEAAGVDADAAGATPRPRRRGRRAARPRRGAGVAAGRAARAVLRAALEGEETR